MIATALLLPQPTWVDDGRVITTSQVPGPSPRFSTVTGTRDALAQRASREMEATIRALGLGTGGGTSLGDGKGVGEGTGSGDGTPDGQIGGLIELSSADWLGPGT